jgi:ribonuclease E
VDVKLVELGLHDPTTGVGKVDQYEIVVANAAKLVGKKVSIVVGRALEGAAYAMLADAAIAGETPITFEAEAEKPTRAPRGKKEIEEPVASDVDIADAELEDETADEAEVVAVNVEGVDADGQPKKKRTRRGSRGGRGRKKVASESAQEAGDADDANGAGDAERARTPRIHVPPADFDAEASSDEVDVDVPVAAEITDEAAAEPGADGQPKRKRSRRGSRGGKRRRKPAANGDGAAAGDVADPAEAGSNGDGGDEPEVTDGDDNGAEYVPMSEWIEDFDSRSRT